MSDIHLSEEEKREIKAALEKAGCSPDEPFKLNGLPESIYKFLEETAKKHGLGQRARPIVEAAGFITTRSSLDKLLELAQNRLRDGPLSRDKIESGEIPTMNELKRCCVPLVNYGGRDDPGRLSAVEVIDSLYPEYPHLSHRVVGTRAIRRELGLTPPKVGMLLREMYFRGENISPVALHDSKDPICRAVWNCLNRWGAASKKKSERSETAQIEKLSGIARCNFSQRDKARIIGLTSEDFVRLVLGTTAILDWKGESQTQKFRECFPLPVIGVYPHDYNPELKGARLEYKHEKKDDKKLFADLVVESLEDVCMVEVKNIQANPRDVAKKLKEKILRKRALYWPEKQRDVTKKTVVVQSDKETYEELLSLIGDDKKSASFVSPFEFKDSLQIALKQLSEAGYLRTNVYSVEELLSAYDLLSQRAHILIRWSRGSELGFLENTLEGIVSRIQKGQTVSNFEEVSVFCKKSEIQHGIFGQYRTFVLPIDETPYNEARNELESKINNIPEDAVFVSAETRGTRGPLIGFCTGYRHGDKFVFQAAFANNPFQEAALLDYLSEELHKYEQIVTYDKDGVDIEALQRRLTAQIIRQELPAKVIYVNDITTDNAADYFRKLIEYDRKEKSMPNSEMTGAYSLWTEHGDTEMIGKVLESSVDSVLRAALCYASPEYRVEQK